MEGTLIKRLHGSKYETLIKSMNNDSLAKFFINLESKNTWKSLHLEIMSKSEIWHVLAIIVGTRVNVEVNFAQELHPSSSSLDIL